MMTPIDLGKMVSVCVLCTVWNVSPTCGQDVLLGIDLHPGITVDGSSGDTILIESNDQIGSDFWTVRAILNLTSSKEVWIDPAPALVPQRVYRGARVSVPVAAPIENMTFVPAGSFLMGSPGGEAGRFSNEGPQTQVTFSSGFWVGKYEVTQEEYLGLMGVNPSQFKGSLWGDDLSRPVEFVTWNEATAYCDAVTERERLPFDNKIPAGYEYRLPTEAEWEYACRAGMTTSFNFGESLPPDYGRLTDHAWYPSNAGSITHAVGSKKPNNWGLFDMHGNVVEWCFDSFDGSNLPGGAVSDPIGDTGSFRSARGGSWATEPRFSRSASRSGKSPEIANNSTGFRVVLAPAIGN